MSLLSIPTLFIAPGLREKARALNMFIDPHPGMEPKKRLQVAQDKLIQPWVSRDPRAGGVRWDESTLLMVKCLVSEVGRSARAVSQRACCDDVLLQQLP